VSDIRDSIASRFIASTIFKPVPGGYVYCAPDRVFGPSRCYLVNEAQKAEIVAINTPRRPVLSQVVLWIVFSLMVGATALILWAYTGHDDPTTADGLIIVAMALIEAPLGLLLLLSWKLRQLRPVLAGLPLTDERITRSDVQQALQRSANATSKKQLVVQGSIGILAGMTMFANFVLQASFGHFALALIFLAGTGLFAIAATKVLVRAMSKTEQHTP
jgi:hypothetical protein